MTSPNLTVKRSFTVRNVGELPVFVHKFYINGLECEGYGYSVLNCASFELPINGTKKIDVAFTPDFTLTKVQRTLTIDTSLGIDVNYTLVTTLPPFFLSACSSVLSRPTWEPLLYYSAVSFMVFLLFCVLAAAFFESDRILKCALMTLARDRTTIPLDLRQIGINVIKEFNQSSSKKLDNNAEHMEKGKHKDGASNSNIWSSADDKHFSHMQSEETSEIQGKSEESTLFGKDKDSCTLPSITGIVQLNNFPKKKKKLSKKNSNSSDTIAEQTHDNTPNRKKEKNFSNASWCNVFSRGNSEKMKGKTSFIENESVKQVRNELEAKKDDNKKEDKKVNKPKKVVNKEPTKEEEETSSTMTDSSNDAEKENSEITTRIKNEAFKKAFHKDRKTNVLECKENNYEGDCDDEDFEKEKKNSEKSVWKVNNKSNKFGNVPDTSINIWKPNHGEALKSQDFLKPKTNKNSRERKEKNGNKRRFGEKIINPKG